MAELQRFARSEVRRSWLHVSAALRTHRLEPTQGPRYPGRDRPTPAWLPTPGLPHPGTTFEDTNSSPSHRVGRGPTPGATGGSPPNIKPWAVGGGQAPAPNGLHLSGTHWHCCAMTQNPTSAPQGCIFCAIVARQAEASVVFEDETVVVFMDRYPVTPGHLLVVPRQHAVGLEDLDRATSAHVWSVGHDMSRALRRSPCAARGSTSSSVTAKPPFRRFSTSTFTSSLATQETAGSSFLSRRNARGHYSTAKRKRSRTPLRRPTERWLPLMPRPGRSADPTHQGSTLIAAGVLRGSSPYASQKSGPGRT